MPSKKGFVGGHGIVKEVSANFIDTCLEVPEYM